MVTVKDQAGLLTNGLHSTVRARTAYQSLTCGEAPFSSVREQIVPGDCVDTFLPTPKELYKCSTYYNIPSVRRGAHPIQGWGDESVQTHPIRVGR
eukprot:270406-Prymnesium_polylepis.1